MSDTPPFAPPAEMDVAPVIRLDDDAFKAELSAIIPHLRAFGRSLTGSRDSADDLVQETMLKAWAARERFNAGTSMRAWTFVILRNLFLSQMRRNRFHGDWDDLVADRVLAAPAGQDKQIELADAHRAMRQLPLPQREALILVGAGGFAYEEAAEICGVAVGTIKSRVARARASLDAIIAEGKLPHRRRDDIGGEDAMKDMLDQVDSISGG